jgi:ubiquinone/menaquinone biosynthesis C-methylase UbiE
MRSSELELIDGPLENLAEVEQNLREMEWMLRLIGTGSRIRRRFDRVKRNPVRILDVGAGSGWISRMLRDHARKRGVRTEIVALDNSPVMLECAQRTDSDGIFFTLSDARNLKFQTRAFDFVFTSAMMHHLSEKDARTVVREIDRVTSGMWIVSDLRRTMLTYAGAKVLTRLTSRNRLTRHDGPLSARRAFSLREFQALAADIPGVRCESWLPVSMALVCAKD